MHWRTFLVYNAAGGILWAVVYGTIGYLAGRFFHDNFGQVERVASTVSWIGGAAIIIVALIVFFLVRWRRKQATSQVKAEEAGPRKEAEEEISLTSSELVSPSPIATSATSEVLDTH